MKGGIDIYYDEEGDFLEITIVPSPKQNYCEDIHEDVFVRKDSDTNDIVGIGVLNFKMHKEDLKKLLADIPIKINFETIS